MKKLYLVLYLLAFATCVNAQTSDIQQSLARGNEAFQLGRYTLAAFEYQQATQWPGDHLARAQFNLGICWHRLGKFQAAINAYREALKLRDGRDAAIAYALGLALLDAQENNAAIKAFQQTIEAAHGQHPAAEFELGLAWQRRKDYARALLHYDRALTVSGNRLLREGEAVVHNNRGVILVHLGNYEEAERAFAVAIKHSRGKLKEANANLARCRTRFTTAQPALLAQLEMSAAPRPMISLQP